MKMMMLIGLGIFSIAAQCATVAELKTLVANKGKEITELRKTNPACLMNPNAAKTIRNREIKMIDRELSQQESNIYSRNFLVHEMQGRIRCGVWT